MFQEIKCSFLFARDLAFIFYVQNHQSPHDDLGVEGPLDMSPSDILQFMYTCVKKASTNVFSSHFTFALPLGTFMEQRVMSKSHRYRSFLPVHP